MPARPVAPARRRGSRCAVGPASRGLQGATLQVAVGLGAHVVGSGCVPTGRGLLLSLPLALVAVLALGRLLPGSALQRLGAGQLAVHGSLAFAACTGAAVQSPALLVYSHVLAVVALRAAGDRVRVLLTEALRLLGALAVRKLRPASAVTVAPRTRVLALVSQDVPPRQAQVRTVRWRGPPARAQVPLPG